MVLKTRLLMCLRLFVFVTSDHFKWIWVGHHCGETFILIAHFSRDLHRESLLEEHCIVWGVHIPIDFILCVCVCVCEFSCNTWNNHKITVYIVVNIVIPYLRLGENQSWKKRLTYLWLWISLLSYDLARAKGQGRHLLSFQFG